MLTSLLIYASVICLEPKIDDQRSINKGRMSEIEIDAINRAKFVCGFTYKGCLKTLTIGNNNHFIAICSKDYHK